MICLIGESPKTGKLAVHKGFTLVEVIISSVILAFFFQLGVYVWQNFLFRTTDTLTKRLYLQMEARKAMINLFRELQEGIEVTSPNCGYTYPFLVFKNYVNQIKIIYLEKDESKSKAEKHDIFRAVISSMNGSASSSQDKTVLMENVLELNFTPYSIGGVFVSGSLLGGGGTYSFMNFVRLQNSSSEDED
ncbi:MAG: type II secretion system protein [Candidatus Riflebacteria bacterium]|nr:type II secretion system protein [Candidatus Riflebacteria bacterium]